MPLDRRETNAGAWSSRPPHQPGPQLPAFCRSRRPTVMVTASSLIGLRGLVLLGLAFQISTWPDGEPHDATPIRTSPDLGDDGRGLCSPWDEPRNPPPAAAARGAHPGQALQALGLHPGPGAPAVAPGERGGHHHRLEPATSAALNATNRA